MKRHELTKGKRRGKPKPKPSGESEMGGADLVLRRGRERGSPCLHGCAAPSLVTCDLRPRST